MTSKNFDNFRPRSSEDMVPVARAFGSQWHALFHTILTRTDAELDMIAWSDHRVGERYIVTANTQHSTLETYEDTIQNPLNSTTRRAHVDVGLDNTRIRFSYSAGGTFCGMSNSIATASTIFYRADPPYLNEVSEPSVLPIEPHSQHLHWRFLEDTKYRNSPPMLNRVYYTPEDGGRYSTTLTPVSGSEESLSTNLLATPLNTQERRILDTQGPYAAVFNQVATTLGVMSLLAGEEHSKPFGD